MLNSRAQWHVGLFRCCDDNGDGDMVPLSV